MKKLLLILALAPIFSFGQINIELESHAFVRNSVKRYSCYYGHAAYDENSLITVLNLKNIVRVDVWNGQQKSTYTIPQNGIYDISTPMPTDNFIIVFTDWQGNKLWWYRY